MALTTGSLTITVSGSERIGKQRRNFCSFAIAGGTGALGSGGVALPNKTTSPNAYGMKTKVDVIQVVGQDHNATIGMIWSYDQGNNTLVAQHNATGAATVDLPFVTGLCSTQTLRTIVWGY